MQLEHGWVTLDARPGGGPLFFHLLLLATDRARWRALAPAAWPGGLDSGVCFLEGRRSPLALCFVDRVALFFLGRRNVKF